MASDEKLKPIDRELCALVWAVVQDARDAFLRHRTEGKYIPKDYRPSKLDHFKSGFPHMRRTAGFAAETVNYDGVFGLGGSDRDGINMRELESWPSLLSYAEQNERLRQSFLVEELQEPGSRREDFFHLSVWSIPGSTFDRLMRVKGEAFSYEDFLSVYLELEAGHLRDELNFAILVPIVLASFETEGMLLGEKVGVKKLEDGEQLARVSEHGSPASPANEVVVGAATHALLIGGYRASNFCGDPYPSYSQPAWWPTEEIDRFFDALRVVTGVDTGYAQLCMKPIDGWAISFTRDLPPLVSGPEVRRYPEHFDNFGWLKEGIEPISEEALGEVGDLYRILGERSRLSLAARRLSNAMLRTDEDDKILDLLIGLEALLGDESKTEMAYKLAMRTAGVLSMRSHAEAGSIFGNVKKLYDYRSAVAHGDRKRAEKRRLIQTEDGEFRATEIAEEYLRNAIQFLSSRPDLNKPSDIDSKLLLRFLGAPNERIAGDENLSSG